MEEPERTVNITPYDNEVTLLYKWVRAFQLPTQLIVVRPRVSPEDDEIVSGTDRLVFEAAPEMVYRLYLDGYTPSEVYEIMTNASKTVNIDDIALSYMDIFRTQDPNADLLPLVNEVYRQINTEMTEEKFEDRHSLEVYRGTWEEHLDELRSQQLRRLESIEGIQGKLEQINTEQEAISFSPPTINSTIVSFSPTIEGRPVVADDGMDIFNNAVVSRYVPYIRYNDSYGRGMSKVFAGGKIESAPNYDITIIPAANAADKNTIYMRLWLGDPEGDGTADLHSAPRESFFNVIYRLSSNYLTVKAPVGAEARKGLIQDENVAFQRTQAALAGLDFGVGKETKVGGSFNIWGIDYDESSLLHLILNDPVMNVYLYVEESMKPFAFKKNLGIHYRSILSDQEEGRTPTGEAYISNSASVSVTFNQKSIVADENVDVMDLKTGTAFKGTLPVGTPYIHVNISQAESRQTVNKFLPIFQLLMGYYQTQRAAVSELYSGCIAELAALPALLEQRKRRVVTTDTTILALTKKKAVNKRDFAKLARLQELAPDLFIDQYPRVCQCPLQPIIVDAAEAEAWKQRRVGPALLERPIMPFPPDNPRWNFVCPSDKSPYPGVKLNTKLGNQAQYPYVPCCFKKDQMTADVNSHYRDYVENRPPDFTKGAKAEKPITTRKILSPGAIAYLPRAVESVVKRYSDDFIGMFRYGVIYSTNSLLHCVCVAIDDPNYIAQESFALRNDYVTRIRQHMLGTVLPSLLKQEMYDYTDAEIVALLGDNNTFLDPDLFYRAVEETFQINIYVFSDESPAGTGMGSMAIPRFKIFHSRPLKLERPTVVLFKSMGSESDNLEYPHCELIVDIDQAAGQIMKLFGPEMTEVCHSTLQASLKTITWTTLPNNTFDVHANIYNYIDHLNLFGLPAVSQYIDSNGKMRALTLNANGQELTITTIPSQPENLLVRTDVARAPADLALEMFGDPTGVTRDTEGRVTGLWFQIMDIANGEYVPVVPTVGLAEVPQGKPDPLRPAGMNVTGRLSKLRRTLNIIKQIARWLYELAKLTLAITPELFVTSYLSRNDDPVPDSANYYDLTRIPRRYPQVTTVEDGIRALSRLAPTLFQGGRMVMYNLDFANRIYQMIVDYSNLQTGKPAQPPSFIADYYVIASDYRQAPNTKIFISDEDLNAWLTTTRSSGNYSRFYNIRTQVVVGMGFTQDPYLYEDEVGHVYIIQNVAAGTLEKAMAVATTWNLHRVNIGFNPAPLEGFDPYMIYGISPASKIIPVEDHTQGLEAFLRVLYYGSQANKMAGRDGRYGAILRIL